MDVTGGGRSSRKRLLVYFARVVRGVGGWLILLQLKSEKIAVVIEKRVFSQEALRK